jgi:hypothetical protein
MRDLGAVLDHEQPLPMWQVIKCSSVAGYVSGVGTMGRGHFTGVGIMRVSNRHVERVFNTSQKNAMATTVDLIAICRPSPNHPGRAAFHLSHSLSRQQTS